MSKFLKLVEENRPGEDKYTVELKDVNGELIDSFELFGVGSPFEIFDSFKQEYAPDIPIEDNEAKDSVEAISAIASLPDQGFMKGTLTKTGRRLKRAKQTMASAAEKIAKKLDAAAGGP
jgi:hypothetical protein